MSLINVSKLSFSYEGSYDNIFENVSFQLDTDWKTGFIGRNGRGKTTFLKLLMGKYKYSGTIISQSEFLYFTFDIADNAITAVDAIYSVFPDIEFWELCRELNILKFDQSVLYNPFSTLSKGEQTKLMLAAMFLRNNSFLLIDEPTNHLDSLGREIVSNYLHTKKGFILVSHDRAFLDKCVDHILSINKTNIELQKGNFSSWYENKQNQDNLELIQNIKLKKEIKRLSDSLARISGWSNEVEKTKFNTRNSGLKPDRGYIGSKSAKIMKRSLTLNNRIENAIESKSKLLKNIETTGNIKITQQAFSSNRLVTLNKVSIFYSDTPTVKNVSFSVMSGDRIAIRGSNGSGKSSILKLIYGEKLNYTGTIYIGSNLKISYVPQDVSHLSGNLKDFAMSAKIDESLFKSILRNLGFARSQFDKNIEDFSMGQKKKTAIAKSLCENSHLLIWDEPLNYIDVFSRKQIEDLILKYTPTIIYIEHDITFCKNTATEIIEI